MIQTLDTCWFWVVRTALDWAWRHGHAHYRRKAVRRLRQELAWQKPHLN